MALSAVEQSYSQRQMPSVANVERPEQPAAGCDVEKTGGACQRSNSTSSDPLSDIDGCQRSKERASSNT